MSNVWLGFILAWVGSHRTAWHRVEIRPRLHCVTPLIVGINTRWRHSTCHLHWQACSVRPMVLLSPDVKSREGHHDANFVAIGGTTGCRYDNLWCHQGDKVGISASSEEDWLLDWLLMAIAQRTTSRSQLGPPPAPYKFAASESISFLPAMKYHGVKMSMQVIVMVSNLDDKVSQSERFFVSVFCVYGVLYQLPFVHLGLAVISVIETGMSSFRGNFHHSLHQLWWNQGQKFRQNDFSVSIFHLTPLPIYRPSKYWKCAISTLSVLFPGKPRGSISRQRLIPYELI